MTKKKKRFNSVVCGILKKLNRFQTSLLRHYVYQGISNVTKTIWDERINNIKATITNTHTTTRRRRRGLINIIGEISHTLFGTATEQEIIDTRYQIDIMHQQNKKSMHVVSRLITVLNHTNDHSQRITDHINSLQIYVAKVADEITSITDEFQQQETSINVLKAGIQTDRALALIETTHNLWLRQLDLYHVQRAALEMGYLTETILPLRELKNILHLARQDNSYAPTPAWYYAYVKIQPLWQEDGLLVFRASLPLIDRHKYLRFHIHTWPIPGNTSQFTIQLQTPHDVAFHTTTGGIFTPRGCIGSNPAICRTGPIYNRNSMQCPRGILTGEKSLRAFCAVTIARAITPSTTVQEYRQA